MTTARMSAGALRRSYELWRDREVKAFRLWRSRVKRLDQDDPRRGEAFRAYQHAQEMRKRRARDLSRLPVTHMDAEGRRDLIASEGVRRWAYNDSAGHATFGVGHLIHLGPVNAADRRRWGTPQRPLSMAVVDATLARDLAKYERAVRDVTRASWVKVTQPMFNALVSLCFNIGIGGFTSSSVARHLKAGHKQAAANAFLLWDNPPELRPRRERERRLFLS